MRHFITLALSALVTMQCFGWGQKGHDVTCTIAKRHMTANANKAVMELLDGKSMVYWANWLDNASHTAEYAYTKTWHYRNVDADQTWETAPNLPEGDIVRALNEQIAKLKATETPRSERQLALKMVIHLMGDLHQPLHIGRSTDRGGNNHKITFFKQPNNLHSVWDSNILEAGHKWSYTEWADEIDNASTEEAAQIRQGNISDWGKETHTICQTVYEETPENSNISYDEVAKWTLVIEQQLLRGGIRLASVLNEIFN